MKLSTEAKEKLDLLLPKEKVCDQCEMKLDDETKIILVDEIDENLLFYYCTWHCLRYEMYKDIKSGGQIEEFERSFYKDRFILGNR